jgi:N-acetylglucosamine repressor
MNANIDASTMRRMNRATVLRLIRDLRTTSRIDVAQMTGLNKATVSNIVDELIREQLVHEIGYGSSSGGRKPILLRFNANAAYAIGVDIQISHITTVVCNIRGETVYRQTQPVQFKQTINTPQTEHTAREETIDTLHLKHPGSLSQTFDSDEQSHLLHMVEEEIQRAIQAVPHSPYGLVGIGVGLPGMVNFQSGIIYYIPKLFRGQWNLQKHLTDKFSLPVFCDNDANCGAWNEYMTHTTRVPSLVYIHAGVGIGAGLVIDGKLYRGRDGIAGEFGHLTINPMGSACLCGSYGCWEEYASERSLLRYLREAGADESLFSEDRPLMEQVIKQAQLDNRTYIRAFHSLGQYLGIGIANVMNTLNPHELVLGGSILGASTFVLPEIERVVKHRSLLKNKPIPVRIGNMNAVAIGAACLTIDEVLFSSPTNPTPP